MNPDGTGKALFVSSAILMTIYRQYQSHIIPASLLPSTLQSPSLISPSAVTHRKIWFGEEALTHLQSKARYDMSPLDDLSLFVSWCRETNTSRLKEDEEYRLKATQRNIRVQHKEDLLSLQKQLQEAQERWKDHALFVRHQTLVREIEGKEKAIANMERFLKIDLATITKDSEREKILRTRVAFETNQAEVRGMQEELATLLALPDHQRVIACQDALQILTSSLGLDQIKTDLAHTQKERGGKRGERGRSFEDDCADAVLSHLLPHLKRKFRLSEEQAAGLVIVRNATLGIASFAGSPGEFDVLVCLPTESWQDDESPGARAISRKNVQQVPLFRCSVLAVVEAKRNPDDLGTAFSGLQAALAWLCGHKEAYRPSDWTNKNYPSGHFDRPFLLPVTPRQSLVVDQRSFALFSAIPASVSSALLAALPPHCQGQSRLREKLEPRLPRLFIEDLYFVTREGSFENLSSRDYSLLLHHLASDLELDDELSEDSVPALDSLRLALRHGHGPGHGPADEATQRSPQEGKEEREKAEDLTTSEVLTLLQTFGLHNQLLLLQR